MRLLKRDNTSVSQTSPDKGQLGNAIESTASVLLQIEMLDMIKPIKIRKDNFISPDAQLSGCLEGQGNVVIEERLDGDIRSTHQVRVESGGQVIGDIHAQHIVINGKVEGRLYADAIKLLSEGHILGYIFTDSIIIDKGGVFIG